MNTLLRSMLAILCLAALAWGTLEFAGEASAPAELPALSPAAERGRMLATDLGCTACHSLDGSMGIGPPWGAYGLPRTFSDGSTGVADEDYLRSSMLDPAAKVLQGYANLMLPAVLTEAQLADIVALIRELDSSAR